jgi:hypothetical protein
MKNTLKVLAALAVLGFAGNAFAQNTASTGGTASGTLIKPIAIYAGPNEPNGPGTGLQFGNLVSAAVAGTVVVNSDGSINYTGDPTAQPGSQAGTTTAQTWEVTGQPGFLYNISVPGAVSYAGSPTAWGSMTFTPQTITGSPFTMPIGGQDFHNQGGSLAIPANQATGNYTASWTETASYN